MTLLQVSGFIAVYCTVSLITALGIGAMIRAGSGDTEEVA